MSPVKRGNASNMRSQSQLLEDRRNLLIQLYCISHIAEVKNVENHELIAKEIEQFLTNHDLAKGGRVDINALPKFRLRDTALDRKLNRSKSASPADAKREVKKRSKETSPTGSDELEVESSAGTALPQTRHVSRNQSVPQVQQQRDKKENLREKDAANQRSTSRHEAQGPLTDNVPKNADKDHNVDAVQYLESQSTPSTASEKRVLDSEEELAEQPVNKRQRAEKDASANVSSIPPEKTMNLPLDAYGPMFDVSQLHAEPTPIEIAERQPFVVESILKNFGKKEREIFFKDDINVKESLYMVTKESAPATLAKSMPIQEIKYVSQTLPLLKLIPQSQKALTTDLINTALNDGRITVVASRIEELRRLNLWSLRQPKKFLDPITQNQALTHTNVLIQEAKWMREDFRESLNFKIAMCTELAQAISDYWNYGKVCCVQRKEISHLSKEIDHIESSQDLGSKISTDQHVDNTIPNQPESSSSTSAPESEDQEDSIMVDASMELPEEDNVQMEIHNSVEQPTIDTKHLTEMIDPKKEIQSHHLPTVSYESYMEKKAPSMFRPFININELSALACAVTNCIPLYEGLNEKNLEDDAPLPFEPVSKAIVPLDDDHFMKLIEKQIVDDEPSLVSLSKRRGMFYGNRRSHYLRPPAAPSLRYLKFRTPTIWLPEDDQELVKNINQYAYNWDLISSQMSNRHKRVYISNIERRTPWQCFERFVQLNEKFNIADMKGPRAHNAQIWLYEAHKLQQQQKRRISPLGVGSESIQRGHRRLRWASMFEAMRKCIKKRENAPRPNPSLPRKPLDVKNMSVPTPQEMSDLKAQRDEALRRDIQMKRAAKQRMELAQLQQQGKLPLAAASSPNLPVMTNGTGKDIRSKSKQSTPQSAPLLGEKAKVTTQTPNKRNGKPSNEREIIEGYAKKILLQKPNFTPELALMAAENIYRNVTLPEQQGKTKNSDITTQDHAKKSDTKNASPTPQEILQRAQKK